MHEHEWKNVNRGDNQLVLQDYFPLNFIYYRLSVYIYVQYIVYVCALETGQTVNLAEHFYCLIACFDKFIWIGDVVL